VLTTIFSGGVRQVNQFCRLRNRRLLCQQESRAHGNTIGTHRQCGDKASPVAKSAGCRDWDVNRIAHLGKKNRCRNRSGVTTALSALYDHRIGAHFDGLNGVAFSTNRWDTHNTRRLQSLNGRC